MLIIYEKGYRVNAEKDWNIMKEIVPYHKKTYNCVHDMIYTLSKFFDCDYQMLLLETLGIKYSEAGKKISDRLDFVIDGIQHREYILKKFHGIGYVHNEKNGISFYDLNKFIDEKRIGVYWDTFDCEWLPSYRKFHGTHFCLVTDCDDEYIYCIDQFSKCCSDLKISKDQFCLNHGTVTIYKETGNFSSVLDYVNELTRTIESYKNKKCLENICNYLSDIQNISLLVQEIDTDVKASKFLFQLKHISDDKINFCEVLDYIQNIAKVDFEDSQKMLLDIHRDYEQLRAIIMRGMISRRPINMMLLESLCDYLKEKEEGFIKEISAKL